MRVSSCSSVAANINPPRHKALTFARGMIEHGVRHHRDGVCALVAAVKASGCCTQSVLQHLGSSSVRDGRSSGSQCGPKVNAWETVL